MPRSIQSSATLVATPLQMERVVGCRVSVLYGGASSEREVSLVSGRAVLDALQEYVGAQGLAEVQGIEIDAAGRWWVEGERLAPQDALGRLAPDTLFFLGLHGGPGEDGTVQGFLDLTDRRYTGSGLAASALCMDKRSTRVLCSDVGLRVAGGVHIARADWRRDPERRIAAGWKAAGGEAVVKPTDGGSSVLTQHVHTQDELASALAQVFEVCDGALVEAWIHGLEATVGVVGQRGGELCALPVVEIRPHDGRFFDFEEKYSSDGARETCPPRELERPAIDALTGDALLAYRTLGCDGYARADFIVPGDGGDPVLLEVNTLPGFTPRSLLPQAAAVAGVDFAPLCLELCALALAGPCT